MTQGIKLPCMGATDLFYGPEDDLRNEPDKERKEREGRAEEACLPCPMKVDCLAHALRNKETMGVWGGMATGKRRRFLKFIKSHRKSKWETALYDLEYLTARSEIFHQKEEVRLAKIARERTSPEGRSATVVVIGKTKRGADPRAGSVTDRNRGRAVAGGRSASASASAADNRSGRPARKAASAAQAPSKRKVQRQR